MSTSIASLASCSQWTNWSVNSAAAYMCCHMESLVVAMACSCSPFVHNPSVVAAVRGSCIYSVGAYYHRDFVAASVEAAGCFPAADNSAFAVVVAAAVVADHNPYLSPLLINSDKNV